MKDFRAPTVEEMVRAYENAKAAGLKHIRLARDRVGDERRTGLAIILQYGKEDGAAPREAR